MGANTVTSPESTEDMMSYAIKDTSSQSSIYLAAPAYFIESSTPVRENVQRRQGSVNKIIKTRGKLGREKRRRHRNRYRKVEGITSEDLWLQDDIGPRRR